ncbi:MAG TPA: tRNA (N6-isopentenyl adenosine(37)-C2)-methylthiotransferase MiaB, partial [Rhodobacteraceae bacterium]|nr:tRNA (N6-isopentenyl adenosine(37)-C2)-methylthiotransferase MiaB [Paracoccaceae bacterium]
QVEEAVKTKRLHRLQDLLWSQQRGLQKRMVGREVSVLFEKAGRDAEQMV